MGTIKIQLLGGIGAGTGKSSVPCTFVPTPHFRTRGDAGAALVDLAPDSATWRPSVS